MRVPTDVKRTVALYQTDQILILGIQSCLWFALRVGVSPVRSAGVCSIKVPVLQVSCCFVSPV